MKLLAMAGLVAPIAAPLALMVMPPAEGRMLVAPIGPQAPSAILWLADTPARIVAPGPWPGSFIVEARRGDLLGVALNHQSIIIAAQGGGCSTREPRS